MTTTDTSTSIPTTATATATARTLAYSEYARYYGNIYSVWRVQLHAVLALLPPHVAPEPAVAALIDLPWSGEVHQEWLDTAPASEIASWAAAVAAPGAGRVQLPAN